MINLHYMIEDYARDLFHIIEKNLGNELKVKAMLKFEVNSLNFVMI